MEQLSGEFKLANATREVRIGSAKLDVLNYADEKAVDLIVIGNHSRHGLARLLGSTASALLHYAPCDILTVHLGED
jgi:universal stress protein A